MKFAHMADLHIGGWRDSHLKKISSESFIKAIDICIGEKVDFILFAGDLFNTTLPNIDILKLVVKKLKQLKEELIPVYAIPGSHDFSPSGKTILDVLEEAGLLINVFKIQNNKLIPTIDKKTNTKITGIIGKRGMLDKKYYEQLEFQVDDAKSAFKIFMFHTALDELKPSYLKMMKSEPITLLPTGFDYYAGGHVHIVKRYDGEKYKNIVYPGPLFPNNFLELEKLGKGGFYIYDSGKLERIDIEIKKHKGLKLNCENKTPENITKTLLDWSEKHDVKDSIITLRLEGEISAGRISDIQFKQIFDLLYRKKAYFVMKNTIKLTTENIEEITTTNTVEEIEEQIMKEYSGKISGMTKDVEMATMLLGALSQEKREGERVYEYKARIKDDAFKILEL